MTQAVLQVEDELVSPSHLSRVGLVVPTYNATKYWHNLRPAIDSQGLDPEQVVIIDSSSTDATPDLARRAGYQLVQIERKSFNHGGTRQQAGDCLPWADILVYLTQDALPAGPETFRNLCAAFTDPSVGAAYGRQLPRYQAGPIERHARLFNYPPQSNVRGFESRHRFGIKAAFLSNSFAAYRRAALTQVGGFPSDVIMAEDSLVAAKLLLAGWKVAYVADASVVHSHPLTLTQEFSRYFDTGVHHARERWILDSFGKAGQEGARFLRSEFIYLCSTNVGLIPVAAVRTLSKLLAYQLGRREAHLPTALKTALSSQPGFWHRSTTRPGSQSAPASQEYELLEVPDQADHRPVRS